MARFGRSQPFKPRFGRPDLGPVYFDNSSTSTYEAALSTYSWNHTVGTNSNRLLTVGVSIFATGSVTGITYGGVALTKLRSDDTGVYRSEIWYLIAPASGTASVAVTLSASLTSIAGAASWWNVDQTNPFSANAGGTGTNTPASAAVTPGSTLNRVFGNLAAQTATGITDQIRQAPHYNSAGALGTQIGAELGVILTAASTTIQWNGLGAIDSWAVSVAAIQPPQAATFSTLWQPIYPDSIARSLAVPARLQFFATGSTASSLPVPETSCLPVYPSKIDRPQVRAADQSFYVSGATASSFPVPELAWQAKYPDAINRGMVRAVDQAFFFTGATHSSLPVPALSWGPLYPDKIWRVTLPTAAVPWFSAEPFPRPPAALLSAWAIYPDRIDRFSIHASRVPSFVPGPLVPIPNPVSTYKIEDRVLLGQNQSLETPAYPSIGGSSTWS